MTRRIIPVVLGLLLLPGCERNYEPTVRQSTITPRAAKSEAPSDTPHAKAADETHAKAADGPHAKTAAETHAKLVDGAKAEVADASKPKAAGVTRPAFMQKAAPVDLESRDVKLGAMNLVAPETWTRRQPPFPMIAAHFDLPRAEGDPRDARLTITAVGKSNQEKLDGLLEQFNKKTKDRGSVKRVEIGGIQVTVLDFAGMHGNQQAPFVPEGTQGGFRILNAMLPIGDELYIVNCSGPEKTMGERADEFHAFLQSMKASSSP